MKLLETFKRKLRKAIKTFFSRGMNKSQIKLSEFFRTFPLADIDLSRDKSLPRKGIDIVNPRE